MAQQYWLHDCACEMLQVKELPIALRNHLDDIEWYASSMLGSIQSRQVVATILAQYVMTQRLERKVKLLEDKINETE
tara:strand:- start:686 stop:916 length:231 start_codon:yes stop_codon:yes gene_type:complete